MQNNLPNNSLVADTSDRLDVFLARMLPEHSRSRLVKAIESGAVQVDGLTVKPGLKLKPGQVVSVGPLQESNVHDLTPHEHPLEILFEDEHLLVVNKPRGMATHPAPSLKEPSLVNVLLGLKTPLSQHAGAFRPGIVHRLDKETTGLLLVAKTDQMHAALSKLIANRSIQRTYATIVAGRVDKTDFVIDAPMGRDPKHRTKMAISANGKPARTHGRVIRFVDAGTLLRVKLETGRTHQIRVHLLAAGFPVLGDSIYAPVAHQGVPLQLHAIRIEFEHPATGLPISIFAPPPEDFLAPVAITDIDP